MTTALIVDDHEQNSYLLQTLLEGYGYTVVQARNGSEALELARHNPPNIVISDIFMPVMDGFALCREWKKDERLQNIPFVFYTATYTDPKDEALGLSLGAARFIIKPTEPEAFVVILQQVIQEHATGGLVAPRQPVQEETVYYRLYNEALVRKLEDKMLELEQVNRALEQDITERKRAEARIIHLNEVLRAVRNVNQLITRERDPQRLMSHACAILVQTRGYRLVWIGLIEEGHRCVIPAARAGQGTDYLDQVTITWDESETGQGPTGVAIRTRQPAICANIATGPRYAPWREAALQHDFASSAAAPVLWGERLFGTVNVYADKPDAFDDEEIGLLAELAGDLGFALQSIEDEAKRKQAEEALAQERLLLRTVIDNLPDAIYAKDRQGRKTLANRADLENIGRPEAEVLGKTDAEFFPPQVAVHFEADDQRVFQSGQPVLNREEQLVKPEGKEIWLLTSKLPLKDAAGQIIGLVGIGHDITERKQAEETLRNSEAQLSIAMEIARLGYWEYDAADDLLTFNDQFYSMFRTSVDQVGGYKMSAARYIERFLHPDDMPMVAAEMKKSLETTDPHLSGQIEHRIIYGDGKIGYISMRYSIVKDNQGRTVKTCGVMQDITERKRAEAQLERTLRETRVRFEVSQALAGAETEDEVLDVLMQHAGLYSQAHVAILTFDRTGSELAVILRRQDTFESGLIVTLPTGTRLPASSFPIINLFRSDQPFVSNDLLADERVDPAARELYRPGGVASHAAFPLTAGNEWMGFIGVTAKPPSYFDEEKQHLYQTLAEQGAVALRTARLRETIRESQQRLSLLVQQSPLAVIEWNTEFQVVSWNPAAERILGYTREEALGRHAAGLIEPEEARPRLDQIWQAVLAHKGGTHHTRDHLTKDGCRITCEVFYSPLVGADGQVIGVVSLVEDITERKRAEEELARRAEQLALLYDAGLALNSVLDPFAQLDVMFNIAIKTLHADRAEFFRYDAARNELRFELGIGHTDAAQDALRGLGFRVGDERGVVGQVSQNRTPLYVPDVSALPNWVAIDPELRSGLWVPVEHEAQLRGVLAVLSTRTNAFTPQDEQLLALFANQAAVALENARLFEAERAGRQRLEILYRIGQAINSTLDAGAILDRLTDEAMRATHATHGSALIALADLGRFERRSLRGYSPEQTQKARNIPLPLNRGVNGRAYQTRQVAYLSDVQTDPDYFPLIPETRSELAVPIMRGGQVLGNLDLQSPELDAFRDADLGFLQTLTDQVAIALENARLFGETRRHMDEMSVISNVALVGAAGRPFDETVERATAALSRLWPEAPLGFLFLDETDQSLRPHPSYHGASPETLATWRIPMDKGITGWAVRERQPLRVGDVTADPRYIATVPGAASKMAAPLVAGERVIGVVNVESPRLNAFSGDDLRLLTTLAGQLATIFEKARLDMALEEERASLARRVEERTVELNVANAELRQAARAKDEFLASMSHELRTPLNAILGISEALQEQVFGPLNEKQLRYLHTVEESGQHLLALINDILDLSKVEAGKVELQISRVVVESVCQASLQFIKEAAHRKKVKVSSSLDSKVSTMQADERRLKQILVNLLSNAVKFTPEGGEIGLQMLGDAERQRVHFIVWDTGIGIAREDIGRLFQPFVQLDSSLSRQYSGTGLGLSLVKRLAELHGGSVSVESQVGKGSRFTVSLPWRVVSEDKRVASDEERVGKEGALDARPAASVAVLLAEDSETNLTAMSDYLSAKGYRVIVARNGGEAIRRAGEDRPDVVLMDIQMPGMDGLEAIRHIRAEPDPRVAHVPIIALTAIAMSGDRQRCIEAGANEYLSKPVSLKELVEVIETQLRET